MTRTPSPDLQAKIEREAEANTHDFKDTNDYDAGYIQGYKDGYEIAGSNYAMEWEQAEKQIEKMAKALQIIQKWQLPPTGRFGHNTQPMSYEAAFGSNGVRDFMKNIANQALTDYQTYKNSDNE